MRGGGTRGCGTPAPLCQVEGDSEGTRGEGLQCVVPGDGVSVSFLGKWNGVPSADGTHVLPNRRKFQMASQHDVACHQALTEMPASGDILHHCWELIYHLPPAPTYGVEAPVIRPRCRGGKRGWERLVSTLHGPDGPGGEATRGSARRAFLLSPGENGGCGREAGRWGAAGPDSPEEQNLRGCPKHSVTRVNDNAIFKKSKSMQKIHDEQSFSFK